MLFDRCGEGFDPFLADADGFGPGRDTNVADVHIVIASDTHARLNAERDVELPLVLNQL